MIVYDRCERPIWSTNAIEAGPTPEMVHAAPLAKSLKEAIEKPKSRFHRSRPCQPD